MRVLYVDDDRLNSFLFESQCAAVGGFEVRCAGSGAEALASVGPWRPDLLVIDLNLPDTQGYALLPALRAALSQPDLPAMLCTAEHPDDVIGGAREAGFTGLLDKPVAPEALARLRDAHSST